MFKIITKLFLFNFLLINIVGCSALVNNTGISSSSGSITYSYNIAHVQLGKTKKQVQDILGSPSFVSDFNSNIWYYVYQKTWYISVLRERLVNQEVYILTFNKQGSLINMATKSLKDVKKLPLYNKTTNFKYKFKYSKPDLY